MKDNAKCFIRIAKGIFEEITYKELENRKKTEKSYRNKKFIPIQRNVARGNKRRVPRIL